MYFMFFPLPGCFLGFQNLHHAIISWPQRQLVDFLARTPAPRDVDVRKNSEVFVQMFVLSSYCLPMYFDAQEVSQKSRYLCLRRSVCDALLSRMFGHSLVNIVIYG